MLKLKLKVSANAICEVDGDQEVDIFEGVASMQEVFSIDQCGCCKSTKLRYVVRQDSEDNKYYELHCQNFGQCGARLPFGQAKKGGSLYPKVRWAQLSKGEQAKRISQQEKCTDFGYLPDSGWYKWKEVEKQD